MVRRAPKTASDNDRIFLVTGRGTELQLAVSGAAKL